MFVSKAPKLRSNNIDDNRKFLSYFRSKSSSPWIWLRNLSNCPCLARAFNLLPRWTTMFILPRWPRNSNSFTHRPLPHLLISWMWPKLVYIDLFLYKNPSFLAFFKKELSLWKRKHQQKVSNQLVENHHLYSQNQKKKTKTLFDFFIHSEFFVCKNYWNSYRFYCTWNSYVKLDIHHWDDQHDQKKLK